MDIRNRRAIQSAASEALAANPGNPRHTVIVYVIITTLSALLVSALVTVLDQRIANTGGLGNMGLRSILSTIRTILPLAQTIALLGLELGYQGAAVRMARRQDVSPRTLLTGCSHFGPLLRSLLLQWLLYFVLATGAMYVSAFLFMATPLSNGFFSLIEPMMTDPDALYNALYNDEAFFLRASETMMPMIPLFLVIFLAAVSPFFYGYRMVNYCILEAPRKGALAAMGESWRMMKGNRIALLKLDLSFWWFYLAQFVIGLICYGDVLLPLLGVTLPWSATASYYVFYIISLVLQAGLYCLFLNRLETTYAVVYENLRPKPQPHQGGVVLGNIFDLARDYKED